MSNNEKVGKAIEEFIRTHSPAEVVEAARKASPHSFSNTPPSRPPPSSVYRNGSAKPKK
jgi:hypothetical protein